MLLKHRVWDSKKVFRSIRRERSYHQLICNHFYMTFHRFCSHLKIKDWVYKEMQLNKLFKNVFHQARLSLFLTSMTSWEPFLSWSWKTQMIQMIFRSQGSRTQIQVFCLTIQSLKKKDCKLRSAWSQLQTRLKNKPEFGFKKTLDMNGVDSGRHQHQAKYL